MARDGGADRPSPTGPMSEAAAGGGARYPIGTSTTRTLPLASSSTTISPGSAA